MLSMLLLSIYFFVLQKECKIKSPYNFKSNQSSKKNMAPKKMSSLRVLKFIKLYQSSLQFSVNLNICEKASKNLNSAFLLTICDFQISYINFSKYNSRRVTFNQSRTIMPSSYRSQSIDLQSKSIDWFLYEGNIGP